VRVIGFLRRPVAGDAILALFLLAASLWAQSAVFFPDETVQAKLAAADRMDGREYLLLWTIATIPAIAGLLVRRRLPLPAYLLAGGSACVHLVAGSAFDLLDPQVLPLLPMDLAAPITLYTLASLTASRRTGMAALGAGLLALASVTWIRGSPFNDVAVPALLLGIAWALGDNTRTGRLHLAAVEERARDLRRDRDQRAQLAIAAERARITRDLHDVVAHGISVMVLQAQGAATALRSHPDRTATALDNITATGRDSLTELRRLLGLNRPDPDEPAPLSPQPGIGALPALIDQVRDAGTPVTLRVEGEPIPLPAGVDLSVYRIVQEALTNTLKHAGTGARVEVRLTFGSTRFEVDVTDDGRGTANAALPTTNGNGLRGIAERVAALGGTVSVGPRKQGGFAVHARLPIDAAVS